MIGCGLSPGGWSAVAPEMEEPTAATEPELLMGPKDWNWHYEAGFAIAEGRVKNISGRSLDGVVAVAEWEAADGMFITSDDALIDYQPILPGQTSPWSIIGTWNPAMKNGHARVSFRHILGGTIGTNTSEE